MNMKGTPSQFSGFHEARKDLGAPRAWAVYGGGDRFPLALGVAAVGLDEFLTRVLPDL